MGAGLKDRVKKLFTTLLIAVFHAFIRPADISRCSIPDHTDIQGVGNGRCEESSMLLLAQNENILKMANRYKIPNLNSLKYAHNQKIVFVIPELLIE